MKKEKIIGIKSYNFTFNNTIGKGEFCSVYKSLDLNTNKNAKLKQIVLKNDKDKYLILNDNLMKYINLFYSIKLIDHFIDKKFYYLVMELCDDGLVNYVKNKGKLKIKVNQKILIQINDV